MHKDWLCSRMQEGSGCQAPPVRRCPLIPCPARRIAHSSTAVPRDLHLRDEDSQAQRTGVCWTLKPVLNHSRDCPHCPSGSSPTWPSLAASVSSLVSPSSPSQLPSALCLLCLAKFMGDPGEACPSCLHPCLDHGLPLANLLWGFWFCLFIVCLFVCFNPSDIPGFYF